jgi:hypothetical protein
MSKEAEAIALVVYATAITGLLIYRWESWGYYKTRFDAQRKTLESYATNEDSLREKQFVSLTQNQESFYKQNEQINELKKWMRRNYSESEQAEHMKFPTWVDLVIWLLTKERVEK